MPESQLPFLASRQERYRVNPWRGIALPALGVGEAPLLAVTDHDASLWILCRRPVRADSWLPLGAAAVEAWERANLALQTLPLLWRPLDQLRRAEVAALCLGRSALPGRQTIADANVGQIDGASFGLILALAQASAVLDLPLPADLAATAGVEPGGALSSVSGVTHKIMVLGRHAPRIRRLLVARGNADEATTAAKGIGIEVVAVDHLAQALDTAFPNLIEHFVAVGRDATARQMVLGCLLDLAWGNRGQVRNWEPIRRTAEHALQNWPPNDADQKLLEFVRSVALRHDGGAQDMPIPSPSALDALPEPRRTGLLAHLVQNAADSGQIDTAEVEYLALAALPGAWNSCFAAHLQVHGALARLWAVTGRERQALQRTEATTQAWLLRRLPADACYPLAVWLRLAGVLGDAEAFQRARDARAQVDTAIAVAEPAYLDLAEAQGALALGDTARAFTLLERIQPLNNARLPDHVRFSALRHWLRCPQLGDEERARVGAALQQGATSQSNVARFWLLSQLDARTSATAQPWIAELGRLEPSRVGQLLHFAPADADPGAFLTARYPY